MKNPLVIAEIGQAHDGSLGILHSYIDAVAKTGVDAIKFQTHIAEAESSIYEPFRVNFSYEDKTRLDYWKRMEFTPAQWATIKKHCDDVNIEFISSPFSLAAVDLLEKTGVNRYKVGSGEVSNSLLIEKLIGTKKDIILSSGMSSFSELDSTVSKIKAGGSSLTILQCTTAYPTMPEEWGLNVILELKKRYKVPIGFSDHSGDIFACLAAAAMGAEIFEFHVVFDKQMFGPDSKASIPLHDVPRLVKGINDIRLAYKTKIDKNNIEKLRSLKQIFEKSLAVNKDLNAGHIINIEDIETKKPYGKGVPAKEYKKIIGKSLRIAKKQWDFITEEDFND